MILTLEVMGEQAAQLGAARRKVFNAIGGTVGRLPDNDWVIPDPYVSGRHALIRYVNGRFFIEDTSTNGVFINSPDARMSRTQAQPLRHGDVLYVDAYQISVSIEQDADAGKDASSDPIAVLRDHANRREKREAVVQRTELLPPPDSNQTVGMDPPPAAAASAAQASNETQWFGLSEMSMAELQAAARAGVPGAQAAVESDELPDALSPQDGGHGDHLATLLAAAGMTQVPVTDETARTLGAVLHVVVERLTEMLRSREQLKDELHLRGTVLKSADNNPLKFSANADDAFHNLFVKRNPAYLEPADAFREVLTDVRDHQDALQAAMRSAFSAVLAQFDPERLQKEFDRQAKGSILGVPAKLRYWDLYREKYGATTRDTEAGFRNLFSAEFAKAYAAHIERLKSADTER